MKPNTLVNVKMYKTTIIKIPHRGPRTEIIKQHKRHFKSRCSLKKGGGHLMNSRRSKSMKSGKE